MVFAKQSSSATAAANVCNRSEFAKRNHKKREIAKYTFARSVLKRKRWFGWKTGVNKEENNAVLRICENRECTWRVHQKEESEKRKRNQRQLKKERCKTVVHEWSNQRNWRSVAPTKKKTKNEPNRMWKKLQSVVASSTSVAAWKLEYKLL